MQRTSPGEAPKSWVSVVPSSSLPSVTPSLPSATPPPPGSPLPTTPSPAASTLPAAPERRDRVDRRRRQVWAVVYGSFKPRRRTLPRRLGDSRFHSLDWYSAHLLAISIGILLLCGADAFLTLLLLSGGADEVNPIMAAFVYKNVAVFAALKMAMTSISVVMMVFLSRYRFMRLIRVEWVMYGVLAAYASLIAYEIWMLKDGAALLGGL